MIINTTPDTEKIRIQGHRLGMHGLTQSPVSSLAFLSYAPDMTGLSGAPIAVVIAELYGKKYDQIHILNVIEIYRHDRKALSRELLKAYGYRAFGDVWADLEVLKWFNADSQFTNMAIEQQELYGWKTYPGVKAITRYHVKTGANRLAEMTAWQATILDEIEAARDSEGKPVLRYTKNVSSKQELMDRFKLRGKSTTVDGLAGVVYCMKIIAPDIRWQYLQNSQQ